MPQPAQPANPQVTVPTASSEAVQGESAFVDYSGAPMSEGTVAGGRVTIGQASAVASGHSVKSYSQVADTSSSALLDPNWLLSWSHIVLVRARFTLARGREP